MTGRLEEPGTILEAADANEHLAGLREALDDTGMNDPEALATLLRAHTVEGALTLQDIMEAETLTTLAGSDLHVHVEGNTVFVNDAQVIEANIPATNGVIHMLNGLATPAAGS